MKYITLDDVKADPRVQAYIKKTNEYMNISGYTDHGFRHSNLVSHIAYNILHYLGFSKRQSELAEIGAYLHDMGNVTGRKGHEQAGAILALHILNDLGMSPEEQAEISLSIGIHEEPISDINAAVILADKSDVHRSRVQQRDEIAFDIHDRVNYAVTKSFVRVNKEKMIITLSLTIDTKISDIMDYFSIFLARMTMCQRAASFLKCRFGLVINDVMLLGERVGGKIIGSSTDMDGNHLKRDHVKR